MLSPETERVFQNSVPSLRNIFLRDCFARNFKYSLVQRDLFLSSLCVWLMENKINRKNRNRVGHSRDTHNYYSPDQGY